MLSCYRLNGYSGPTFAATLGSAVHTDHVYSLGLGVHDAGARRCEPNVLTASAWFTISLASS